MENLIYLTVKILSAFYLIYRLYLFLFGKKRKNLWRFLNPKSKLKKKDAIIEPEIKIPVHEIVGKSQTVYYDEIPKEEVKPVFSEDLELVPKYEVESEITDDDVENNLKEETLTDNDRFVPLDVEPDNGDFFTGMTFDQLSSAIDVISGNKTDREEVKEAALFLYEIHGSEVFDFLTSQAENEQIIEKLMKDYLDSDGKMIVEDVRKKRPEIENFDIGKYV